MPFSRLLRGTLPVLLLWPLVCSIVTLSLAPARQRAAAMRPMACCVRDERGSECGSCDAGSGSGACGLGTSSTATTGCTLSASPCRRAVPTTLTPFAWEPFTPAPAATIAPDARGRRTAPPPSLRGAMRSIAVMERPPAA